MEHFEITRLRRLREEAERRGEEIRGRTERIEERRRALWERIDRLHAAYAPAPSLPYAP